MSYADNRIRRIEAVNISLEPLRDGELVDKITGEVEASEEKPDLDRARLTIKFSGELGETIIPEPYSHQIYSEIWKFLNETKS